MTILVSDYLLDASADKLIAEGETVHILPSAETTYANVVAASLGSFTPVITKGDATITGGGRKAAIAAATGVAISVGGGGNDDFNHYAVVDDTNSRFLYLGEGTSKTLNDGDTISTPIFNINFANGVESVYP